MRERLSVTQEEDLLIWPITGNGLFLVLESEGVDGSNIVGWDVGQRTFGNQSICWRSLSLKSIEPYAALYGRFGETRCGLRWQHWASLSVLLPLSPWWKSVRVPPQPSSGPFPAFTNVKALKGGWNEWIENKYPVENKWFKLKSNTHRCKICQGIRLRRCIWKSPLEQE